MALSIENSRHYFLDSADADEEWKSVYPGDDHGFLRLGPQKRFFGLSLYHQMHCLDALRATINGKAHHHRSLSQYSYADEDVYEDEDEDEGAYGGEGLETRASEKTKVYHTSHCLNYLRETLLCAADVTLEPEIAPGAQNVGQGLGVTHVCKDWSKVHAFATRNAAAWDAWRHAPKSNQTATQ